MGVPLVAVIRRAPLILGAMASDGEGLRVIVLCPLWSFAALPSRGWAGPTRVERNVQSYSGGAG